MVAPKSFNQFEVYLVQLNPTAGSEINKTRPCVIISPNEMNHAINTVIIAPMTTKTLPYPTRVPVHFAGRSGEIVLDQIGTVDKTRLIKKLGSVSATEARVTLRVLREMFAESQPVPTPQN